MQVAYCCFLPQSSAHDIPVQSDAPLYRDEGLRHYKDSEGPYREYSEVPCPTLKGFKYLSHPRRIVDSHKEELHRSQVQQQQQIQVEMKKLFNHATEHGDYS